MPKKLIKSAPFDIAARLPLQLGRESIASSTAAIGELLKNSYDANAEEVSINFIKLNSPLSLVVIEDDGDGMDLNTLESVWLKIGTEHKSDAVHSRGKNRIFTGAKGLGRLGIDRLCRKLILQTKTAESDSVLELHVDWKKYDDKTATISSVTHKIFSRSLPASNKYGNLFYRKKSGTRLILLGLKEIWSEERLTALRNELSLLVSPFASVNDYTIDFNCPYKSLNGKLSSEKVLDAAVWSVDANIDKNYLISIDLLHSTTGELIKEGPVKWEDWLPERAKPECGPLSMKMYYIPQPEPTAITRKEWSSFMELHNGVRIYRDFFRVRPYGEPSGRGDWLDFGLRKAKNPSGIRQGNWRVAPHQILGAVFISRFENSNLIDQANREGMVETNAFLDLRAFAMKVVSTFENIAIEHARKNAPPDDFDDSKSALDNFIAKSNKAVFELSEAVKTGSSFSDNNIKEKIAEVEKFVIQTQKASEKHERAYAAKKEEIEREKDTLANLASLGILTVCFGHEAKEFCNLAALSAIELKENFMLGKFMISEKIEGEIIDDLDIIIDSTRFIKNFASFSLGNVKKEKRKKGKISIYEISKRVFDSLDESISRQNIEVDITGIPPTIKKITAFEIDWESIIVNMISNSIWALRDTPRGARIIRVSAKDIGGNVEIRFADSGCGIEAGAERHLFNPMYSTRRDERGTVVGTGMGLSIVKTFVIDHAKGTITAIPKGALGGAEFIITIPGEIK
ncbi:ATP-binding protein [Pseudomonas sp. PB105]|uniref:sensor histidine kinase n=1 Tax=unclassified Pseudomonas TaxID=196821 RepID=UPI00131C0F27|nr:MULTISPECIES: ATP-binding protein [unclassified Pseudomonas]KAE9658207.1 ATP-binding protein [Pseudomonas sp. PB105]MVW97121.1 ATP-binding protein [Pseudomonas sp. PB100]